MVEKRRQTCFAFRVRKGKDENISIGVGQETKTGIIFMPGCGLDGEIYSFSINGEGSTNDIKVSANVIK